MYGGIAVARNLLCLAHTDVRGNLFLVDVEEQQLVSHWSYGADESDPRSHADAGGVAMDSSFNIFVADTRNDIVRRFSAFGRHLSDLGRPQERPVGAARRDRMGSLDRPHAVAVHGDVVYVACGERRLVRGVQRFSRSGRVLSPLNSHGESDGRFGAPRGLCLDRGSLFVADTLHGAIQRFRSHGPFIHEFSTAVGPDEASRPIAVVALADGDLLVVDHGDCPGLRRFTISGETVPLEIESGVGLVDPVDLARDDNDRIYVLDRDGERVLRFSPTLEFDTQIVDLAEVGFGEA